MLSRSFAIILRLLPRYFSCQLKQDTNKRKRKYFVGENVDNGCNLIYNRIDNHKIKEKQYEASLFNNES